MKALAKITLVIVLVTAFSVPIYAEATDWALLEARVISLRNEGRYEEATRLAHQYLSIAQDEYGPDSYKAAGWLFHLGDIYKAQGKYSVAEDYYKRSMAISGEGYFGLFRLAEICKAQGKYSEAKDNYKRSLALREDATVLNSFAELYHAQGKYANAEPLLRRSLALRKKKYGHKDPLVAQSLNTLAETYKAQGKYAEAEDLYKQASAIEQKTGKNAKGDITQVILVMMGGVLVFLVLLSLMFMIESVDREDTKFFTEYAQSMGLSYRRMVSDGVSGFSNFRSLGFQNWDHFDHVIYGKTESLGVAIFTCTNKAKKISEWSQQDSQHMLVLLLESDQLSLPSSFENLPSFSVTGSGKRILVRGKVLRYLRPDRQDYKSLLEKVLEALQVSLK